MREWRLAWLGGVLIGVGNDVLREATYARRLGERTGHNVSGATAIIAFAAYFSWLQGRWPLRSRGDALSVGAQWLVMTVAFEFGFGRLVAKRSGRSCWRTTTCAPAALGRSFSLGSRRDRR